MIRPTSRAMSRRYPAAGTASSRQLTERQARRRTPPPLKLPRTSRRACLRASHGQAHRARALGAGLALLAVVVIAAALWFGLRRNTAAPVFARPVPITSFPGLELDPAISPTGTFVTFAWEGESGDNFDIYVRSIDGQLPAATHDRWRGRPCTHMVARRSTDCVRPGPGWKTRNYRSAGAQRSRAAPVRGRAGV